MDTTTATEVTAIRFSFGDIYAITAEGTRTKAGRDLGYTSATKENTHLRCNCGAHHRTPRAFLDHARAARCSTFA